MKVSRARIALFLAMLAISGCDLAPDQIEVPTSAEVHRAGPREECQSWGAGQPVEGELDIVIRGQRAETFVVTAEGERLYIVWPIGFSATTADGGAILDDEGVKVFEHGGNVSLGQVDRRLHAGTVEDPFVAAGIFAGTCFVPEPEAV